MKKLIIIGLALVVFVLLLLLVTAKRDTSNNTEKDNNKGILRLTVYPKESLPVKIYNDSNTINYSVDQESSDIRLPIGRNTYRVSSNGFKDSSFEVDIYGDVMVVKNLRLETDDSSAQKTLLDSVSGAESLISLENGYWINYAKYYENNTWASGVLTVSDKSSDGEQVIAKKQDSGTWTVVYAGTGYDRESLIEYGVPQAVIESVMRR